MLLKLLKVIKESINEYFGICHLILSEVLTLKVINIPLSKRTLPVILF